MQEKKFVLKALKKIAAVGTGVAMLGATLTGALALDLADYPAPFVKDGVYDTSNVFVVGDNALAADTAGMADIVAGLQFEAKTKVSSGGTSVSIVGGESKQIPLGFEVANSTATEYFDAENQDDEVSSLLDSSVTFKGESYNFEEVLKFNSLGPVIKTGVDDDDYGTDVYMEVPKNRIQYYINFKEAINLSETSTTDPLTLDFLGKTLKIVGVDASNNKITAFTGDEYYIKEGESVEVDGKTVTLVAVGSSSIIVDVDGTQKSISSTSGSSNKWNGIEVTVDSTMVKTNEGASSALLVLGTESSATYADKDPYPGEDKDDPDWVWYLSIASSKSSSHIIGVKNDFVKNKLADDPPGIGECIDLPNNYVSVCLDSLSVADDDYMDIKMSIEEEDLSDAGFGNTANGNDMTQAKVLKLEAGANEGFYLQTDDLDAQNYSTDKYVKEMYLAAGLGSTNNESINGTDVGASYKALDVFFKDPDDNKVKWWGAVGSAATPVVAEVNFGDTKSDNMKLKMTRTSDSNSYVNLTWAMTGKQSNDLVSGSDDLKTVWKLSSSKFNNLGPTDDEADGSELIWGSTNLGEKEKDLRTHYGVIVKDPKSNGAKDEVNLQVPSDQVFANVVLKGTTTEVSEGGATYVPTKITPVTKLASEVTEPTKYNLILVGGPCANPLVETVFGMTCDGWTYAEGEGVVKLAANGDKVAMLVAGTTADDTRRAAKAIANYGDYSFSGTEKVVKGTSFSDITVE